MKLGKTFYARNRKEWRAWLSKHHRAAPDIWLVYYRKHTGKPRVPYNDAVEEALCYGWIDSILKPIDADRWAQRYSPRRPTSRLSAMNRERVRRLIAKRRMTKAGLKAIAHVPKLRWKLPVDIERELKRDATVWKNYRRFPESYRRIRIGWIDAARHRRAAFVQRLRYFIKMTALNKRFGMVQ